MNIIKKKIYIAGKITGLPIHEVTMKFGAAQKKLENKGYEVVNPIAVVNDWDTTWDNAMRKCIAALVECDSIALLPDWKSSPGARLENDIAQKLEFVTIQMK